MTHDPLCEVLEDDGFMVAYFGPAGSSDDMGCLSCDLIARVRADMRQRVVNLSYYHDPILPKEHGYNEGREDAIDVLSKAVIGP